MEKCNEKFYNRPNYQRKNILFGIIFLLVAIILMASGCSHTEKVLVPLRVDLNAYNLIGVIEFSTNAENTLKSYLTQNYIKNIQNAQPGILVFELGDKDQLLRSLATVSSIWKVFDQSAKSTMLMRLYWGILKFLK